MRGISLAVAIVAIPAGDGAVYADESGGGGGVIVSPSPTQTASVSSGGAKWGPHIDLRTKLGTRKLGRGDLFIPLWQNDSTLTFLDLRVMGDDDHTIEGNFGAAVRHLMRDSVLGQQWIAGGYGFFDLRSTDEFGEDHTFLGGHRRPRGDVRGLRPSR